MAARVQVIVETKETGSGVLRALANQFSGLGSLVEDLTSANINWGNIATSATQLVVEGFKQAYKVATEYASSVRDVALSSGTTAEEASRLIQVLDDFEIQAGDITTATRAMTKNGLAPTIETIAQLSDRYLALNTAEERNAFIQDNLGRGGAKWANVLKEGSANILAMNDGVSQALILNDQQIKQYEEMRLNQDQFNDNLQAIQVSLINGVVPAVNQLLQAYNEGTRAQQILAESGGKLASVYDKTSRAALDQAHAEAEASKALNENATAAGNSGKAAAQAAADYGKLLSMAEKLNGATREQIKLAAYQDLKQKLTASGGELSAEEAATLQAAGVALGVFDQNAARSADNIENLNNQLAAGTIQLWQYIDALNAIPTEVKVSLNMETGGLNSGINAVGGLVGGSSPDERGATGTQGDWRTVPSRYKNDSFLLALNAGEQYSVRSKTQQSMSNNQTTTGGLNNNYFYGNNTFIISSETGSDLAGVRL